MNGHHVPTQLEDMVLKKMRSHFPSRLLQSRLSVLAAVSRQCSDRAASTTAWTCRKDGCRYLIKANVKQVLNLKACVKQVLIMQLWLGHVCWALNILGKDLGPQELLCRFVVVWSLQTSGRYSGLSQAMAGTPYFITIWRGTIWDYHQPIRPGATPILRRAHSNPLKKPSLWQMHLSLALMASRAWFQILL